MAQFKGETAFFAGVAVFIVDFLGCFKDKRCLSRCIGVGEGADVEYIVAACDANIVGETSVSAIFVTLISDICGAPFFYP